MADLSRLSSASHKSVARDGGGESGLGGPFARLLAMASVTLYTLDLGDNQVVATSIDAIKSILSVEPPGRYVIKLTTCLSTSPSLGIAVWGWGVKHADGHVELEPATPTSDI